MFDCARQSSVPRSQKCDIVLVLYSVTFRYVLCERESACVGGGVGGL